MTYRIIFAGILLFALQGCSKPVSAEADATPRELGSEFDEGVNLADAPKHEAISMNVTLPSNYLQNSTLLGR